VPTKLISSIEVAELLLVKPSALSNWRKRGSGPELPEPFGVVNGHPVWTVEQGRQIVADRIAAIEAAAERILG
jgi:hypothetical protein